MTMPSGFADGQPEAPGESVIGGTLNKAVTINNIFGGMARSGTRRSMAQTQLYSLDACRVMPSRFRDFEKMETTAVFDVQLDGRDDRPVLIFYVAVPAGEA